MKTRSFGEIGVLLIDKAGKTRAIESEEEFMFLERLSYELKAAIPYILKKSASRLDIRPVLLLSKIYSKKLLRRNDYAERERLFDILENDTVDNLGKIEITMLGQKRAFNWPALPSHRLELFNLIQQVYVDNQYDVTEAVIKDKVVVDAGSTNGDFSIFASLFKPKKVYAFEPIEVNFKMLKKNIALNNLQDVIIPVKKALGSTGAKIEMTNSGDGSAIDYAGSAPASGREEVEVTTLDDFFAGKQMDFLKMDVEGYEENILLGARKTIEKYKPVLSFSAYHKKTDKTRLPQVVRDIRPDYKIRFNSYYEEDFYCD